MRGLVGVHDLKGWPVIKRQHVRMILAALLIDLRGRGGRGKLVLR